MGSTFKRTSFFLSVFVVALAGLSPGSAHAWYYGPGYGYDRFHGYGGYGGYGPRYGGGIVLDIGPPVVTRYVDVGPAPAPIYVGPRPTVIEEHRLIGTPVVHVNPVPPAIMRQLSPVPSGYFYCMGETGDVYMVSQYDNTIAQVISVVAR
jgi:hypothetical protein